jgi:hypothetical protein
MINESLKSNDLRHFVKKVVEIDSYKSKIGDDQDIVVLSFTVDHEDPAKDLENFIEMGYDFVLDADVSSGELDDGTYKVYVELERSRHVVDQILELLEGIKKLAGIDTFRFRYFKSFKSQEATFEELSSTVPMDKDGYKINSEKVNLDNFTEFFNRSYADEIKLVDESISFKKIYSGTVKFKVVDSGLKTDMYNKVSGPIMLESKDMAEVMFLTKCIGNYNITKIGNAFIFENSNHAVILEKQ